MTSFSVIRSSAIPSDSPIEDFDVVQVDGHPLVVCVDFGSRVFTWNPLENLWNGHPLDTPYRPEDGLDVIEMTAIGAVVLDGRIVVGGGADHQPFAQWDLETGAVEISADTTHAALGRVIGIEMDG